MAEGESFPRRSARTQRFTLGRPRTFSVAADGSRVVFLRSAAGDDPVTSLWALDVDTGEERVVADARALSSDDDGDDVPAAERARRERVRESAGGIVAYASDARLGVAAFALAGTPYVTDLATGAVAAVPAPGPVVDPRPDPTVRHVAYVYDGSLYVDGALLVGDDDPDVTWGLAEFIAGEEMDRDRGFWWSPDGTALAVARVDEGPVLQWHIADPARPEQPPSSIAYPAAGTANADVTLHVVRVSGGRVEVHWDRDAYPYLVDVRWGHGHPLTLFVQSRDQRRVQVLTADPASGATTVVGEDEGDPWVEIVAGAPAWTDDGRLVTVASREGSRRLLIDGTPLTPVGLEVRSLVHAGTDVVFTASHGDPTQCHVWRGNVRLTDTPGWHAAVAGGDTVVVSSSTMTEDFRAEVRSGGTTTPITSLAEQPSLDVRVTMLVAGRRELRSALLLPDGVHADRSLPVLLDPYGGPYAQRVTRSRPAFFASQWFADQGFAVLVTDGRGTPGRGTAWEHELAGDLATAPLEDQVDALHAVAAEHPALDLTRVAIRGWSFGGYLAALAVLRRPDVFHAAIAGAPVTDWRLYDTHYTERYLGLPDEHPDAYARSSVLADAARLERPLLIIHGLADDNVVAAHSLQLSQALLEAGRPHIFLPLSGVTHMTPQEVVAENLLLLQVAFLRDALHRS